MKRSKLFAITLQSKSGLIFFFVLAAYNLLLGMYLKDFFVLSPLLVTLYLLSELPTLFFVLKIRSTPMRAVVLVVLFFVLGMSLVSSFYCRRLLPMLTFVITAIEMMYFGIVDNSSGKDKLLTKICVLVLTVCSTSFGVGKRMITNCSRRITERFVLLSITNLLLMIRYFPFGLLQ